MDVLPPPGRPSPQPRPTAAAAPAPAEPLPDPQPAPPVPDQPHEAGAAHREAGRLATVIAVSIALVSVLGAVVGWRAEVHGSRASRYEQDAVAASISAAQVRSHAEQLAAQAQSQQEHFERLGREANQLSASACNKSIDSNDILSLDAGALCSTQVEFSGYNSQGYALADDQHAAEHHMLWLSLFLVLVLAFFTLARLRKSRRGQLLLAVPGWACLAAGVVLFVVLGA
jgi:Flp pilus assembly pilin Flp